MIIQPARATRPAPADLPDRRALPDGRALRALPDLRALPEVRALSELRALTERVAAEVRAGHHEVRIDPARRWYRLLSGDGFVDIWLMSWATEQAAEPHDHAGSLGALSVVCGTLTEHSWSRGRAVPRTRTLGAGCSGGFPVGHVHDVLNSRAEPAVSVHAYSPPLTAMSYYEVRPDGRLRRTRSELTEAVLVG